MTNVLDASGIVKSPRSGKGKTPKGMLPIEPIVFEKFPIWERQEYELENWYENFNQFYLTLPSGFRSVNRAFNNAATLAGEEIERTKNKRAKTVPDNWTIAHKMYRWEDRARAFWREKCAEQQEFTRHKLLDMAEKTLQLVDKATKKIEAMLDYPLTKQTVTKRYEDGRPQQIIIEPNGTWSHKDAMTMTKEAFNLVERALFIDDDNYLIQQLTQKGYIVLEGESAGALNSSQNDNDSEMSDELLNSVMSDSEEVYASDVEIILDDYESLEEE